MQSLRVAVAVTSRRLALCRAVSANISLPSTASRCLSTQASTKQTTNHTGVFGLKFDVPIIAAVRRQDRDLGSKASAAARAEGLIPGQVYGTDKNGVKHQVNIWVPYDDLKAQFNSRHLGFHNTLFDIVVDGMAYRVLPRYLSIHPTKPKAMSCDWLIYVPGRNPGVPLSLPTRSINEDRCVAFKQAGWKLDLMHKLPVYAYGEHIPDSLVLDLRGKAVGDKLMASEIHLPPGITWRHPDKDFAVAKFLGTRRNTDAR